MAVKPAELRRAVSVTPAKITQAEGGPAYSSLAQLGADATFEWRGTRIDRNRRRIAAAMFWKQALL